MGFLLGGILASGIFSVGFSSGIFSGGKLECTQKNTVLFWRTNMISYIPVYLVVSPGRAVLSFLASAINI